MESNGHHNFNVRKDIQSVEKTAGDIDFALDTSIFNKVFQKDIRRVYIYKKSERIARALWMVLPAFRDARVLKERLQTLSLSLLDASSAPPPEARLTLSRDLLALMGILSLAKSSGLLSGMNADLISRETQALLHDLASYEDPLVDLPEAPTLSELSRTTAKRPALVRRVQAKRQEQSESQQIEKGHISYIRDTLSDKPESKRKESILSVLRDKGPSDIKDISGVIRSVSEKTIQRELQSLINSGKVIKTGARRWTRYSLAGA